MTRNWYHVGEAAMILAIAVAVGYLALRLRGEL